jgi:acetyl esterase/lipase
MPCRSLAMLTAALVSCSCAVGMAAPTVAVDLAVADHLVPDDPQPEREFRIPVDSVVVTDVTYATIPGYRPLHLDLYRDPAARALRPLVIFVHGGGWAVANPRAGAAFLDFPAVLASLARRGYVVASIEYRLSGEAAFPAQLHDLQAAIRFLRLNAQRFGIDAARVATWGMSAGAQLAALDAVSCDAAAGGQGQVSGEEAACVQGFVGWFGPYDLNAYARDAADGNGIRRLFRCDGACAPETLAAASPIEHVGGKAPPVLLIHGAEDRQVLASQSRAFEQRLRAAGVPAELLLIPAVGHGLIGATPASTREALRQALAETFEFFDRVCRGTRGLPPVSG